MESDHFPTYLIYKRVCLKTTTFLKLNIEVVHILLTISNIVSFGWVRERDMWGIFSESSFLKNFFFFFLYYTFSQCLITEMLISKFYFSKIEHRNKNLCFFSFIWYAFCLIIFRFYIIENYTDIDHCTDIHRCTDIDRCTEGMSTSVQWSTSAHWSKSNEISKTY